MKLLRTWVDMVSSLRLPEPPSPVGVISTPTFPSIWSFGGLPFVIVGRTVFPYVSLSKSVRGRPGPVFGGVAAAAGGGAVVADS
jgi:hypothetical protein